MQDYESTRLWRDALSPRSNDSHEVARARMVVALRDLRDRAALLAAEIPLELKDFTVHDVTHLDALWHLADTIAGPEISLTPTEAFVLGGAFLIHDLGMGLAAWPGGLADLELESDWKDILATCLRQQHGHWPSPDELADPNEEVRRWALQTALREKHAKQASRLALVTWSSTDTTLHLIDNADLRNTYGSLIGRIAASHGWDIEEVRVQFSGPAIGAPVDCPADWTVDPLKLACLMRTADAAHIDARRAPHFLRLLRKPLGLSDEHWHFQGMLQQVQLMEDRLLYTAANPFDVRHAHAWWLCFDTLRMIDRELRNVDTLLVDLKKPRFAARAVSGADSPDRLGRYIPTVGWHPVNAQVVINNVPELTRKLGGERLYGNKPYVAIRELVQNACDATLALSMLYPGIPLAPIRVALTRRGEEWWLEVSDRGVGMSTAVMTGPLLDFGASYWGSQLVRQELPGLAAKGFRPAGTFGIGFYSVFMAGSVVRVRSRRYDEGAADTRVLEFLSGISNRPLLRPASDHERLLQGGTTVEVCLRLDPYAPQGLLDLEGWPRSVTLKELCTWLCPTLPTALDAVDEHGTVVRCIDANDWETLDGASLVSRLSVPTISPGPAVTSIEEVGERVDRLETEEGELAGRAALIARSIVIRDEDGIHRYLEGVVTVGGLRAGNNRQIAGVLLGEPDRADRAAGVPVVSLGSASAWATSQAQKFRGLDQFPFELEQAAEFVVGCGGDTGPLPICYIDSNRLTVTDLMEWATKRDEILVAEDILDERLDEEGNLFYFDFETLKSVRLRPNAVLLSSHGSFSSEATWPNRYPDETWRPQRRSGQVDDDEDPTRAWLYYHQRSLEGYVVRHVWRAWSMGQEEGLKHLDYPDDVVIGAFDDGEEFIARYEVTRIRRG